MKPLEDEAYTQGVFTLGTRKFNTSNDDLSAVNEHSALSLLSQTLNNFFVLFVELE
jgi:hypothetical protein